MLLGLRRWQAVDGLRLATRGAGLFLLPVTVGLVGKHAQRREAAIGDDLAAHLARLLAAHQQAQRAGCQGAATGAGEQAAQVKAAALARLLGAVVPGHALVLQEVLAGSEELVEQAASVHGDLHCLSKNVDSDSSPRRTSDAATVCFRILRAPARGSAGQIGRFHSIKKNAPIDFR